MILKMLDSAHQKTLWLCILPKKLRSEKEYNVIISLSMQRNRKQLFHAVHRPSESENIGIPSTAAAMHARGRPAAVRQHGTRAS
eukprot:COSAG05_NODE_535_length_8871_cov_311.345759_5_plen_84_part_00